VLLSFIPPWLQRIFDLLEDGSSMRRDFWAYALAAVFRVAPATYAGLPDYKHLQENVHKEVAPRGGLSPVLDPFKPSPEIVGKRVPDGDTGNPWFTYAPSDLRLRPRNHQAGAQTLDCRANPLDD
jgi:hypothetical protein